MRSAITGDWRGTLRRKVAWLLLAKLLGLVALRMLFFSSEHRVDVDEAGIAQRLAVEQTGSRER